MAGVVSFSLTRLDASGKASVKDLSKQSLNGIARAAGIFFQGFDKTQLSSIRSQFDKIDFYRIDRVPGYAEAPFRAFEEKRTLKVFLHCDEPDDQELTLKFIFSALMVIALQKKDNPPSEQIEAVDFETEAFLGRLPNQATIPRPPFPGLTLKQGTELFTEVIFEIAQHKAFLHPPLMESDDWSGEWGTEQLASLFKGLSLQYAKSPAFRNIPGIRSVISNLSVPVFPTEKLTRLSSPESRSLRTLLKIGAIRSLFDPLKRNLDADEAAVFINGPEGATFLKFFWGTRKVIVLCVGGFNGDLKHDFERLVRTFQKHRFSLIPENLGNKPLEQSDWVILYRAEIRKIEIDIRGCLQGVTNDPTLNGLREKIGADEFLDEYRKKIDAPDYEQRLLAEAKQLYEEFQKSRRN